MGDESNSSYSINGQNRVILRIDDTSSSMTWREHQHLGWKEASQCDFSNMSFRGVSFAGANFDGAKLDGSDFAGCDFRNAILTNASAKNCNFEETDFAGSKLNNAEFHGSNFKNARFCTTNGAFESAEIDLVDFGRCDLSDAVFIRVLTNASRSVEQCNFNRSVFSGSDMSRCDLQGIDFRTCRFDDTNLIGASLKGCNLEGVDLTSANLLGADLYEVICSDRTIFPNEFVLPRNAKNTDAVRRRSRNRSLVIAGTFALTCVVTSVWVSASKSDSSTASEFHDTTANRDTVLRITDNKIKRLVVPEETELKTSDQTLAQQRSRADSQAGMRHIQRVSHAEEVSPLAVHEVDQIADPIPVPVETITAADDANELYKLHRYAEAIAGFEQMIAKDKMNSAIKGNLARLLATCPEDRFRDGTRAVRLSMEAIVQSNDSDWKLMCIAAAAYAETGDFTSATYWAYKARRTPFSDKTAIDEMLAQFHMKKPCRW